MKKIKWLLIFSLILVYFTLFFKDKVNLIEGEKFITKKIFFDIENNKINLSGEKDKYKVCFYLDASQNESIERIKGIKSIMSIYSENKFDYVLIWENEIPLSELKNVGLADSKNISLKGKRNLTQIKPSSFIINEDNEVEVIAGPSYLKLTRKIYELANNKGKFLDNVNNMIMNNVYKNYPNEIDMTKDILLIFTSTSCKRCTEVDNLISDNLTLMKAEFNVIDVKPDFDEGKKYSNITEIDHHLTYFRTYASIYDLNSLPLFVIIDSNLKVKDYFYNIEDFITYIR